MADRGGGGRTGEIRGRNIKETGEGVGRDILKNGSKILWEDNRRSLSLFDRSAIATAVCYAEWKQKHQDRSLLWKEGRINVAIRQQLVVVSVACGRWAARGGRCGPASKMECWRPGYTDGQTWAVERSALQVGQHRVFSYFCVTNKTFTSMITPLSGFLVITTLILMYSPVDLMWIAAKKKKPHQSESNLHKMWHSYKTHYLFHISKLWNQMLSAPICIPSLAHYLVFCNYDHFLQSHPLHVSKYTIRYVIW